MQNANAGTASGQERGGRSAVDAAARARREATANKLRVTLGLAMVLISVVLGFLSGSLAVGVGLAVLAVLRLLILRLQMG